MHISVLGPQCFPMIVNSLEELNVTVTFDPEQHCGFSAWIGGTTNTLHLIFDYSSSPDQYIPDNSGMYINNKVYDYSGGYYCRLNHRGDNYI